MKFVKLALGYFSYPIILIVFLLCWRIEHENRRLVEANEGLKARQRDIIASANSPILIRGLDVNLLPQMERVEERHGTADAPSDRQLILMYRAGCGACQQQAEGWKRLVGDARMAGVETWLVSLGDASPEMRPIVDVLRQRSAPYRVLRVTNVEPFVISTGLRAVPMTIVTQGHGPTSSVRLVQQGVADESRIELLLKALATETAALGARIFPDAQMEPL